MFDSDTESPVQQNPYVDVGVRSSLRLNINTDQTGRIFQDRSHVFILRPRPDGLETEKLYNLNVRGKRGNIVQVYPAVEYDFHPNSLVVQATDLVHIQWTGNYNSKHTSLSAVKLLCTAKYWQLMGLYIICNTNHYQEFIN